MNPNRPSVLSLVARMSPALVAVAMVLAGCGTDAAPVAAPDGASSSVVGPSSTDAPATAPPTTVATTTSLPPPLPEASPPISSPGTNKLLVVGDSVILGAKGTLPAELKGWDVTFDARESRFITNALDVLKAHQADAGKAQAAARDKVVKAYADAGRPPPPAEPARSITDVLGRVAVISLCTNYEAGGGFAGHIDQVMDYLADLDRVVWVTCSEWSPGQVEANQAVAAARQRHPTLVVADWARFTITPGYTYEDQIHLREPGQAELAKVVARAVGDAPVPPPAAPTTTLPRPTIPPPTTTTTTTADAPATEP